MSGLFYTEKKKRNIERMCEQNDANYQSQQHFISHSPWDAQGAMKIVAKKTNNVLGDYTKQCLLIDESSHRKAGNRSVGVSRQYNGNLGKVDNSQTGVYAALAKDEFACLVRSKLFLPQEWVDDVDRCLKAGIPKNKIEYKTKPELAIEMIKELDEEGIGYGWIGADSLYGRNYEFRQALEKMNKRYIVDVPKDQPIHLERPTIYLPQKQSNRGPKISQYVCDNQFVTVEKYMSSLTENDWKNIEYRHGTKAKLGGKYHFKTVWVWNPGEQCAQELTLIIKESKDRTKYSLSNFNLNEVSEEQLAYMQGQRYLVEDCFKDSKGELGLFDYQIRKYNSWCHHNALVMMAMQFVLEVLIKNNEKLPLLSVRDVRLQLIKILRNGGVEIDREIRQMGYRHYQKALDIITRFRRGNLSSA